MEFFSDRNTRPAGSRSESWSFNHFFAIYFLLLAYILGRWSNKCLINQAWSRPYWENIGPRPFLDGPRADISSGMALALG